ncbi:hypothetical protein FH972_011576 [Carpinus fangiana]|uniref:Prephenate dehydratase domain-containing protein n=1 Tax=Carpinus fangiana TaxID=176857 RepID=A0A660KTK2_9ROSI|nr:hypothetical protein FH972_011576 [Carpinus fangiana]
MAALIVRSPTTLLWSQGTSKLSPAEDRLKPTHVRYPKRLGYFPALALSLSRNSDSIFHGSFLPRVAYQALRYTCSESVAKKLYPNYEAVPCQQYNQVFEAFKRGVADVAVLQIDPMSHYRIYDRLLNQDLHIVGGANVTIKGYIDTRAPAVVMSMGLDDPAAGTAKTSIVFSLDCHPEEAFARACLILNRRQMKLTRILSRHRHEWTLQESLRDSICNINNRIPE